MGNSHIFTTNVKKDVINISSISMPIHIHSCDVTFYKQ